MLLVGALLLLGAVALVSVFWEDIKQFLIKGIEKLQQVLNSNIYGSKISIRKAGEQEYIETARHYVRKETHWHETTIKKKVPPKDIPKDILDRAKYDLDLDITEELKLELSKAQS